MSQGREIGGRRYESACFSEENVRQVQGYSSEGCGQSDLCQPET
jgi:hypothetical protein